MDLFDKSKNNISIKEKLSHDFPAGIVVFLVAIPLCLGIAFASGVPLISGLISGIIGGIVVSLISGSKIAVSGPSAAHIIIVVQAIEKLGGFEGFLFAVLIAGILQILFGYLRAGVISNFFPSSVVKGMLAGIGVILILKQIPHALGDDMDFIGDFNFFQWDHENTFSELVHAFLKFLSGAAIISALSIAIMIYWPKIASPKLKFIPAALVAVVVSILINSLFGIYLPSFAVGEEHLVNVPVYTGISDLPNFFTFPDFSQWKNINVYLIGFTLAIIASLESLLSINAMDKLGTRKTVTPPNLELKAQGVGNIVSSLIGGLPLTAAIVRSAANADAGAKSKFSSIIHGILLLVSIMVFPKFINLIPLSCLASILIVVGYKLTSVTLFRSMYRMGWEHFIPFALTILGILFTDLIKGIGIGMAVSALFILRRNIMNPYVFELKDDDAGKKLRLILAEEVSFLNKPQIMKSLKSIPENSEVIIDGSKSKYVDIDIINLIEDFKIRAAEKNISLELVGLNHVYEVLNYKKEIKPSNKDYDQLFINNRNWVKEKISADPDYFKKMSIGQAPKYLFIGCSDSRVPDSEITGTDPGEMFVHRNVANLVVHTDLNLMSVLHYSVEVLKVEHVIVCGHYGCGGVKASLDNHDHGLIDKWLANIKHVYRLYYDELENISDEEARHKRLVELNVREQVYHLCMTSIVQKAWNRGQNLQIHGWVYDLSEGLIKDLHVDMKTDKKLFKLYELINPVKVD